jgi:hypothetical protein
VPSDVDRGSRGPNGGVHEDAYGSDKRYREATHSTGAQPSSTGMGPRKLWGDDTGGSAAASEGQ